MSRARIGQADADVRCYARPDGWVAGESDERGNNVGRAPTSSTQRARAMVSLVVRRPTPRTIGRGMLTTEVPSGWTIRKDGGAGARRASRAVFRISKSTACLPMIRPRSASPKWGSEHEKKWTRQPHFWNRALNQFAIHFEGRLPA